MFKCSLDNLDKIFEIISTNSDVYLPVDTDNGCDYKKWEKGMVMSKKLNTNRSPKDFFFPQTEDLVNFKVEGKQIEVIDIRSECEDFVVFGVKACDVKSFEILDRVFLVEPYDSYYANRRERGTIVSLACTRPIETCFCNTFGIDMTNPGGDVICYIENDEIFFDAKTDKGNAFIDKIKSLLTECDNGVVKAQIEKTKEILK